ncbi:MAG: hypothetical protein ABH879_03630 [archaeon]
MGSRHFDTDGSPKLPEIAEEIRGHVENLRLEMGEHGYVIIDPTYNGTADPIEVNMHPDITGVDGRKLCVNDIYVVGSQAEAMLAGGYRMGLDLDLLVRLNAISFGIPGAFSSISYQMMRWLNREYAEVYVRIGSEEYGRLVTTFVRGRDHEVEIPGKPHMLLE